MHCQCSFNSCKFSGGTIVKDFLTLVSKLSFFLNMTVICQNLRITKYTHTRKGN